jgi:cytochrome o ubiquinol oxidase subunit II
MNILDPQGPIAVADKTILIDSIAIMLAIVLPTIAAIFAFAWYFRQSNTRAFYWPDWEYSGRLELVVWSIPALTVILLGGVAGSARISLIPQDRLLGQGRASPSRWCRSTGNGCSSIQTRGLQASIR